MSLLLFAGVCFLIVLVGIVLEALGGEELGDILIGLGVFGLFASGCVWFVLICKSIGL